MQYRLLGKTECRVSALGFGAMRLPLKDKNNPSSIDEDEALKLIRQGIDMGINYVDTAYFYHDGESEKIVGKALSDGYREKTYLATKLPLSCVSCPEDFDIILDKQLKKLGTDYIDFYLLHAVNKERWDMCRSFGFIEKMNRAKAEGKVKHIGFSFHDSLNVFMNILDEYEGCEFCQIQYNYLDTDYQAGKQGLDAAAAKGLGVIVMEPLRGGRLACPDEKTISLLPQNKRPVENALSFVWNESGVSLLLSGMGSASQLYENISYADKYTSGSLSGADKHAFYEAKREYDRRGLIPCTGCLYCQPCPKGVDIPGIFAAYNEIGEGDRRKVYEKMPGIKEEIRKCAACSKCESLCPQNIKIVTELKRIASSL